MSDYRVTFTPNLADAQAAYALFHRLRPLPLAAGAAVSALIGCAVGLASDLPKEALAWPALGGMVVYFLWIGVILWVVLPFRVRRIFRQQKNLSRETALYWDRTGLHTRTANGTSMTPWADYVRFREGEDVILLYHSLALFQFIPRRVLSADDQADLTAATRDIPRKTGWKLWPSKASNA